MNFLKKVNIMNRILNNINNIFDIITDKLQKQEYDLNKLNNLLFQYFIYRINQDKSITIIDILADILEPNKNGFMLETINSINIEKFTTEYGIKNYEVWTDNECIFVDYTESNNMILNKMQKQDRLKVKHK